MVGIGIEDEGLDGGEEICGLCEGMVWVKITRLLPLAVGSHARRTVHGNA